MSENEWLTDLTIEWPDLSSDGAAASVVLQRIVQRLIECLRSNQTQSFEPFFERLEHHMIYGDPELRNLLLLHVLEQLKNITASEDIDYAAFEQWLQPETMVAWRWLEKRWQGKGSLADQVRASKTGDGQADA
jgi:hypothetical protein